MKNGKLNFPIYLLTSEKYDGILNYPVIKINFFSPSISFKNIDYLIFTSKNGVRAVNNITDEWKKIPSFAIGKATAKEIEKLGGIVKFTAKLSYGEDFAKEINDKFKYKTFLFLRAKEIVSNINKYFKQNTLKELIIYETICNKPNFNIKKPAIIIFTSPSTVKCFAKINDFENVLPIAIGEKTKKFLLQFTKKNIFMPERPSIQKCVNLAKNLKFR